LTRLNIFFGRIGIGAIVFTLAIISVDLPPTHFLALLCGIGLVSAILLYPFSGLFLAVLSIQLSGVYTQLFPSVADLAIEGILTVTILGVILNAPKLPRNQRWFPYSPVFILAVLFLLVSFLSAQFSDYPEFAETGLKKLIALIVLLYLILLLAQTKWRIKALLFAIMLSTLISASLGIVSHFSGHSMLEINASASEMRQAGGANLSPTTSANMMLVGTVVGLLLAFRSRKWRLFGMVVALSGSTGILFSFARSASLLLFASFGWLAVKFRHHRRLPAGIAIVAALGIGIFPLIPDYLWNRFENFDADTDYTVGRRLGYHVIGFDIIEKNPLLGVGPGAFPIKYLDYEYRWVEGRGLEARAPHNLYLQVAAETGLTGLAFFLAMIVTALIGLNHVNKQSKDAELQLLAELITFSYVIFLVAAATLPAITNKYTWTLTALAAAVALLERRAHETTKRLTADKITASL